MDFSYYSLTCRRPEELHLLIFLARLDNKYNIVPIDYDIIIKQHHFLYITKGAITFMKDETKQELTSTEEKVTITTSDVDGALMFWDKHNQPMTPELKDAFEQFKLNQTYPNQQKIKLELSKQVATGTLLVGPDFDDVVAEAKDISFNMTFDEQLEEELSK